MKSIKEAEELTGISSQNIRYYEKQGLITPKRAKNNSYREYSDEDINCLKAIKLFRKLDMPIGDIRRVLTGEDTLEEVVRLQIYRLQNEQKKLSAALELCGKISETQLADLDIEHYLDEVEHREKQGSVFAEFVNDYTAVIKSEMVREFSFMPDSWCNKPEEFTEELLKHAMQNDLDMTIIKESLSPRMLINGIEYRAYRTSGRHGITIHCEMVHPEDYKPVGMSDKKYKRYRVLSIIALPILFFIVCNAWVFLQVDYSGLKPIEIFLGMIGPVSVFVADLCFIYYSYGKNFRG